MLQILEHYEQRSGEPARLVRTVNEEVRWRGRIHDVELPPKPKPVRIIMAVGKKVPEESLRQEPSKKKKKAITHSFFDQTRDRLAREREAREREAGRYKALSEEERTRERRAGERIEAMKNARELEKDQAEKARLRDKVRASLESKRYSESERRRQSQEGKRPYSIDEEEENIGGPRERSSSKLRSPSFTDVAATRRSQKERSDLDRIQRERTVLSRLQQSLPPNTRSYREDSEETTVGSRDETDEESIGEYRRARGSMAQKASSMYNDNNQQRRSPQTSSRSSRIRSVGNHGSPEVPTSPPFVPSRRGIDDERLPFSPNSNASSPLGVSPARSVSSTYSARSLRQQQLSQNSKNNISGVAIASDTDESEDTNAVLTSSRMHRLGALRTIKEMYESVLNDRADSSTKDAIRIELESVLRELRSVEALLDKSALGVYEQQPRTRANADYEEDQYRRSDEEEAKELEEGRYPVRTARREEQEEPVSTFIETQQQPPSMTNANNAQFRPIYDGAHVDEYVEGSTPQNAAVAVAEYEQQQQQQQPGEIVSEEPMVMEGQQPQDDQLMMDQMAWVFPTYNWGPFLQDYVFRILQKISGYLIEGILFNEDPEAHFKASTKLFPLEIYDELEEEFNRQLHLRRIIFDSVESMLRDMKANGHPLPIPEYYTSELTRLVDQVFTRFVSSAAIDEGDSAARKVLLEHDGELFRGEVMDYIFRLLKLAVRQFDLDPNNLNNVMTDQDFTACEDHLATDVRTQRKVILLATDEALLDLYPGLATGFVAPMASSQSLKSIVIYGKRPPVDDLHALAKQVTARLQRCVALYGPGLDMSVLQGQEAGDAIGRRLVAEEERLWSDLTHEMDELVLEVAGEMFDVIEESVELEVVRVMDEMEKRDQARLLGSKQEEEGEEQV